MEIRDLRIGPVRAELSLLDIRGDELRSCYEMLPAWRREKADRLRSENDKLLSLGAGLLLKRACERRGIPDADRLVSYSPYGKPFLSEHPEVYFSLSHSGSVVLCLVSDRPVGCDTERIDPRMLRLAPRVLQTEELKQVRSAGPEAEQAEQFTRFWCLKESYMKCTGLGLSLMPERFSFTLSPQGEITLRGHGEGHTFLFREPDAPQGYRIAVCVQEN